MSEDEEFDPITGVCLTCGEYHLAGECPLDDDNRQREAREAEEAELRRKVKALDWTQEHVPCPGCGYDLTKGTAHDLLSDTTSCPQCGLALEPPPNG